MFVTISGLSQWVGKIAGEILIASGTGRLSTAHEAAECVNRAVCNGDANMRLMNEEFDLCYGELIRNRDYA